MIGVVLTYTGNDDETYVDNMAALVVENTEDLPITDENDIQIGTFVRKYYTFVGDDSGEELIFYHVTPFGTQQPSNMDSLNGEAVIYCADATPDLIMDAAYRTVQLGSDYVFNVSDPTLLDPVSAVDSALNPPVTKGGHRQLSQSQVWGQIDTKDEFING